MKKLLTITFLAITYIAYAQELPSKHAIGFAFPMWSKFVIKIIPTDSVFYDCSVLSREPFEEIVNTWKMNELFEKKGEENTVVFYFTLGTHGNTDDDKEKNLGVVLLSKSYSQKRLGYASEILWKEDNKSELPPTNEIKIMQGFLDNGNGINMKKWICDSIRIEKWAHLIDKITIGWFCTMSHYLYGSSNVQKPEAEFSDTLQRAITVQKTLADDKVVVINGVKWATRNVGANNPEDYGIYHKWWETRSICPCTDGWRLPTEEEVEKLINSGSQWATVNGVNGRKFGKGKNTIFLPAAGYNNVELDGTTSEIVNGGTRGNYRVVKSKGSIDIKDAVLLEFDDDNVKVFDFPFGFCFSVRCVAE